MYNRMSIFYEHVNENMSTPTIFPVERGIVLYICHRRKYRPVISGVVINEINK